ncbi:hypothetical protein DRO50_04060 [Candidatus Bathyarchaeota archaeon]|nr:MAG: hypothetical protein DRO50_04060 [Candidatus Bathyarchaeota archaeon]
MKIRVYPSVGHGGARAPRLPGQRELSGGERTAPAVRLSVRLLWETAPAENLQWHGVKATFDFSEMFKFNFRVEGRAVVTVWT